MRKPTDDQSRILAQILAAIDALFTPFRCNNCDAHNHAAVLERRDLYPRVGVAFSVGGTTSQRVAGSRRLDELQDMGLIHCHGAEKREAVSLTTKGDDLVRSIVAGYTARESFPLLSKIQSVYATYKADDPIEAVLEFDLIDSKATSLQLSDLRGLEMKMYPLLARGWADSCSDTQGYVGYYVTDAGRQAVRPRYQRPAEFDQATADVYLDALQEALKKRETWQPSDPHQIAIALPAGMWGEIG